METPIGPLSAADEGLCHQIVDTFAVTQSSDMAWTEKICAMAMARDGSLQLGFGLGRYNNRNVMDAYAGVSRGVEQTTVRASRSLGVDPLTTVIGPIRYEILEPLTTIRFVLEPNDTQPIAFEWVFEAALPCHFEDRSHMRTGNRVGTDLVRHHQTGLCSGWVEVDGARTELSPESWISTRDHSWGVRHGVGAPLVDAEPRAIVAGAYEFFWTPSYLERSDGSHYGLFMVMNHFVRPGLDQKMTWGRVEHPDGRVEIMVDIVPELSYDPVNRRLRGGSVRCTMEDGSTRTLTVEVMDATGFHLGAGNYFGFDGHFHGEWRGDLHVDGERIADCSTVESAHRLHQIRDTVVKITDPAGGGTGWGNWQPIAYGELPHLGLTAETSFM